MGKELDADPRGLFAQIVRGAGDKGLKCMSGAEFEVSPMDSSERREIDDSYQVSPPVGAIRDEQLLRVVLIVDCGEYRPESAEQDDSLSHP
jgi:hypothetical protein